MRTSSQDFYSAKTVDQALSKLSQQLVYSPTPPRTQLVAHCDCFKANKHYLGAKFVRGGRKETDYSASYDMCPTQVTSNGTCLYCGYVTYFQAPRVTDAQLKGVEAAAIKMRLRLSKPVVGVNLETKEEVRFPSAQAAYEAGFGSVNYAIKKRSGLLNGYQWRLA